LNYENIIIQNALIASRNTLNISDDSSQLELFKNSKWEVIDNSKNMKYIFLSGIESLAKFHKVRISFSLFLDLRI
jgi:hypothetical protein